MPSVTRTAHGAGSEHGTRPQGRSTGRWSGAPGTKVRVPAGAEGTVGADPSRKGTGGPARDRPEWPASGSAGPPARLFAQRVLMTQVPARRSCQPRRRSSTRTQTKPR